MLGNKPQYNMAGGKVQGKGFDVNSLLSNPLLHAGVGLLGSKGNGSQAALQGLMQGQQYKQQQDEIAKGNASQDRIQEVANKLQQQYAGSNPMAGTLLGNPETMNQGLSMIGPEFGLGGNQGPASLQEFNAYQQMSPADRSTFMNIKRAQQTFDVGGTRYGMPTQGGQSEALVSPETVAQNAASKASAIKTAQDTATAQVDRTMNQPKALAKLSSARLAAGNVIDAINDAKAATNLGTTGLLGAVASKVPGSDAYDLTKTVETVRANLGFDRLQQMRDESPTGGALGQVAVQELSALQATVSSLDTKQSPDQLMKSLGKIEMHYQNYLDVLQKSYDSAYSSAKPVQSGGASVNWSDMP